MFKQKQNEKWQSFKILELLDGNFLLQHTYKVWYYMVLNVSVVGKELAHKQHTPSDPHWHIRTYYVCIC